MLFKNRQQIIEHGQTPELQKMRKDMLDILSAALEAVDPYNAVSLHVDDEGIKIKDKAIDYSDFENIYLVSFGKASVGMAQAVCDTTDVAKGVVITNDPNNSVKNENVTTIVGGHPIPNQQSIDGAEQIMELVKGCGINDLLIVLISGGGSALLCMPRMLLNDLQQTTDLLLKSGADIKEINTIRKHLSFVKGGQLAASASCRVVSLVISDIVGDPMEFIASGPTYPDSTTFGDAQEILKKYDLWEKLPVTVKNTIVDGVNAKIPETPKKGDPVFGNVNNFIVANNEIACKAAESKARDLGYSQIMLLTTALTGEARDMGKYLIDKAQNHHTEGDSIVFISGGETTVTLKGDGEGGRNQEMVLAGAEMLIDENMVFASFATDGIDGKSDAAGAVADGFTLTKACEQRLDFDQFLQNNDSYGFFKHLDDLLMTGPTGTNVMDIQVIIKLIKG